MSAQSGPAQPVAATGLRNRRNAVLGGALAATLLAAGAYQLLGTGGDDLEEVVASPVRAPRTTASPTPSPTATAPVEVTALSVGNPFAALIPEQAADAGAVLPPGTPGETTTTTVAPGTATTSTPTTPPTTTKTSAGTTTAAPAAPRPPAAVPSPTRPTATATASPRTTTATPTYTWRLVAIDTAEDGTVTTRWSVGERAVEVLTGARFGKGGEAVLQQVKDTAKGPVAVVRTGTGTRALAVGSTLQLHLG